MTEQKTGTYDANVDFEFTQSFNSPHFGPVWSGKRVVIRKSKADLYVKEGKGFIVENTDAEDAAAQKAHAGAPGAITLKGNTTASDVERKGAPATSGDPADKDGTARAGQGAADTATGAAADAADLHKNTIPELKALAEQEKIDLEGATKKDDIIAAIELAREASKKAE